MVPIVFSSSALPIYSAFEKSTKKLFPSNIIGNAPRLQSILFCFAAAAMQKNKNPI
jgi:hypothetical protein